MIAKEQLKNEIDLLDDRYLDLLYNIIRQFPRIRDSNRDSGSGRHIAELFQYIADNGGLGIVNPRKWQREIRKDRSLPFRET